MNARRPLPLTYQSRVWIGVFGAACVLVTLYARLLDATLKADQAATQAQIGLGFAFCLMPLSLAAVPSVLRAWFFAEWRRADSLRRVNALGEARRAYERQFAILKRHVWLETLRGYIFLERASELGLREEVLLALAQISYELRDQEQANHYVWRCLGYNPHNAEALSLLERIRVMPHQGIVGW